MMCYLVPSSVTCCRKWHDDYYYMLEKEFGNERARLVAESMTCGPLSCSGAVAAVTSVPRPLAVCDALTAVLNIALPDLCQLRAVTRLQARDHAPTRILDARSAMQQEGVRLDRGRVPCGAHRVQVHADVGVPVPGGRQLAAQQDPGERAGGANQGIGQRLWQGSRYPPIHPLLQTAG